MKITNLLEEFTTDKILQRKSSRREIFGTLGSLGKKVALSAIPFGLATMPAKVFSQDTPNDAVQALQSALILEFLEDAFYCRALSCKIVPSGRPETVFKQIAKHERAHVEFLIAALEGIGIEPWEKPEFDFTAGGIFDPFAENGLDMESAYEQFLALSQAFEDLGVRAYKGQATNVMGSDFLTPALRIHSVEARHASEVRRLRELKGWITEMERGEGMPEAAQPVYAGEDNVLQGGVDVTTLGSGSPFGVESSTEAYDEPLPWDDVVAIASLFIKTE